MTDLNASEPIPATPKDWDSHHAEVEPGIILSALQWLSRSSLGLILAHWVSRFAPVCVPPGLRADRFADCWLSRFTTLTFDSCPGSAPAYAFDGCPGLRPGLHLALSLAVPVCAGLRSPVSRRWADARSGGTRGVVVLRIEWNGMMG